LGSSAPDEGDDLDAITVPELHLGVLAMGHDGLVHFHGTRGLAEPPELEETANGSRFLQLLRLSIDGHGHGGQS
jgi:hypothetical protein